MNGLKESVVASESVVGSWLSIGHAAVAEIMAMVGFDFVLIDMEHTPISLEVLQQVLHAIEATEGETVPVVRVPDNDPVWIQRVLDTGVENIMVPKVTTVDEARNLVDSTRYPPQGNRGIAGSRATGYGANFEEYVTSVDDDIFTVAQIETENGIENAGAIAATEGINALFVGPADLSGSLGVFGERDSERYVEAVRAVIDSAEQQEVPVGTFGADESDVRTHVEQGFDFVIAGKDAVHLSTGCQRFKDEFFDAVEQCGRR